jgi:hypothetical protein
MRACFLASVRKTRSPSKSATIETAPATSSGRKRDRRPEPSEAGSPLIALLSAARIAPGAHHQPHAHPHDERAGEYDQKEWKDVHCMAS